MYTGTHAASYICVDVENSKQQNVHPPSIPITAHLPQKISELSRLQQSAHGWNSCDWIKEWADALEKSTYPQWEKWFQARDWTCDGHLSVKHPAFFAESVQIGDVNLKHKLYVKGDSYLCGNLYIHGRVIRTNDSPNLNWELESEDINVWEETFDTYHQTLIAHAKENWGGWSIHDKNTQQNTAIIVKFDENKHTVHFQGWNGSSSYKPGVDLIPVRVYIDHMYINQTISSSEFPIQISGHWNWTQHSTLNLQDTTLLLPAVIEWGHPDVILRNTDKLQLHSLEINLIGNTTIYHGSFAVNQRFEICQNGAGNFYGEMFNFKECVTAKCGIFKETITSNDGIFDGIIHGNRIITTGSAWIGGTLQIASGFSLHVEQIVIESSNNWLQLPDAAAQIPVKNLCVEYWGPYFVPKSRPLTEKEPGKLINKQMGSHLDADGYRVVNLAEPEDKTDAVTKEYVDRMRLPWLQLAPVKLWIQQNEIMKILKFVKQSSDWSGKISCNTNLKIVGLKRGDRIGIYPDNCSIWHVHADGCGIFEVVETFDTTKPVSWRQYDFLLTIAHDFKNWVCQTQDQEPSSLWVGGPKSIQNGGGYIWIIEYKQNQLMWNILMDWAETNDQIHSQIEYLQNRLTSLELEFKNIKH